MKEKQVSIQLTKHLVGCIVTCFFYLVTINQESDILNDKNQYIVLITCINHNMLWLIHQKSAEVFDILRGKKAV